jgi:excisionase family DNA binding protein
VRDVRDWNKYVDMVGKAVSKRTPTVTPEGEPQAAVREVASPAPAEFNVGTIQTLSTATPRKGRGPRREETREELLSRLIDPTLTLEETAKILEVCPTTVRRYTNKGILPHERSQGNQRRFKLSRVLAFRDAQTRGDAGEDAGVE